MVSFGHNDASCFFSRKILRESSGKYMCSNLLTLKMLSTNSFTLTFMVLVVDWLVGLLVGCGRGRNCGCLCLLSLSFVCFFCYCMFCFVLSGCSLACLGFFVGWLLSLFFKKDKISEVQNCIQFDHVQHVSSKNTKLPFSKKKTDA